MSNLIPPPSVEPPHITFSSLDEDYMFNDLWQLDCDMYVAVEQTESGEPVTTDNYKQAGLVRDDLDTCYAQYNILKDDSEGSDGNKMYDNMNIAMSDNDCGYIFSTLVEDAKLDGTGPAINTENGLQEFFNTSEDGVDNWNRCQMAFNEYYSDYAPPA